MIKEKCKGAYEAEYSNGLLVVRILGEIDHHSAVSVRGGIDEKIAVTKPIKLIFDLSKVDFMDSSGLGLILGRYSLIKKYGGDMVILNPSKNIMKILTLAGVERIIKIESIDINAEKEKIKSKN